MTFVCRDLEQLCYELDCQAQIPGICEGGRGEPAHSNRLAHGKGRGLKAHSCFVAACCRACHRAIDQSNTMSRDERQAHWQGAFERTLVALWSRGLVQVAGKREKREKAPAAIPKILPRDAYQRRGF